MFSRKLGVMLRIAATFLMICFSLTHAGASSLLAPLSVSAEPNDKAFVIENVGLDLSEFEAKATARCCMGDDVAPLAPCKNGDCHYLLQDQVCVLTPDYIHVISIAVSSTLIDRQTDSLLRPPIATI